MMPYNMSPQQMMQYGLSMTQPRQPNQPTGFLPPSTYGGIPATPNSGGFGGMQTSPNQSDPLDAYSDDDIARAYNKRQQRLRIGGKTYGGP